MKSREKKNRKFPNILTKILRSLRLIKKKKRKEKKKMDKTIKMINDQKLAKQIKGFISIKHFPIYFYPDLYL